MWSPTLEQKSRIADTLVFMISELPAIPENVVAYSVAADWKKSCEDALPGTVEKMKARWPSTEFIDRCAEVWLFPLERYERPKLWEDETLRALVGGLEWMGKTVFLASPSAYGVNLLIDRIEYMFRNPMACCERVEPNHGDYYYTPSMIDCLQTLSTLSHMPSVLSFIEEIVVGRFNCADFERPVNFKDEQNNRFENSYKVFDGINGYLAAPFHEFWKVLDQAKKFEYTHFRSCCLALPRMLPSFAFGDAKADEMSPDKLAEEHWRKPHAGRNPLEEKTHQFARDFAWEAAEAFDEKNAELLLNFYGLQGARYLLRACELLEADRTIKKINRVRGYRTPVSDALGLMVRITAFEEHDDPDELFEKLKSFSPRVLKIIQPIGGVAQDQINAALAAVTGAKDFGPAQRFIRTLNTSFAGDYSIEANSNDPTRGVLEQETVRAVFKGYSDDDVRAALDMALKSDGELRPAVMMIQALMGWNVEEIQEKLEKRNQLAVRGYGLLPLQYRRGGAQGVLGALPQVACIRQREQPVRAAAPRQRACGGGSKPGESCQYRRTG